MILIAIFVERLILIFVLNVQHNNPILNDNKYRNIYPDSINIAFF